MRKTDPDVLEPDDALQPVPPFECSERDTDRWNNEWLTKYLAREWSTQLTPHSAIPGRKPLPEKPSELLSFKLEGSPALALYCAGEDLQGRAVMEIGCGCGNLGKVLGRYAAQYLGVDFSTLALKIARLVSPENCTYHHVSDRDALSDHFGKIDTAISRFFWIHQNATLARYNLDFLLHFVKPGGRIYLDFFWPDPGRKQGVVHSPDHPLSRKFPSATFKYTRRDVDVLTAGLPLRVLTEEVHRGTQRRYIVLARDL